MNTTSQQLENARAFLNELAEKPPRIPYEPELLPLLFAATRENSTASLDDIAACIERSQNLATHLLKIANSAYYVLEFKVASLARAIGVLGLKEVRSMVLMVGMVAAIKGVTLPPGFDSHGLWAHQLKTASLARFLAEVLRSGTVWKPERPEHDLAMDPDEAYAAGLLHDLGKVFLASARPDDWNAVTALQKAEGCGFAEAETAYWGVDHGIVAARVLHTWKVPLLLTDAINWHHAPLLAPQHRLEASLLAAADALAGRRYTAGSPLDEDIRMLLPDGTNPEKFVAALAMRMQNDRSAELTEMI